MGIWYGLLHKKSTTYLVLGDTSFTRFCLTTSTYVDIYIKYNIYIYIEINTHIYIYYICWRDEYLYQIIICSHAEKVYRVDFLWSLSRPILILWVNPPTKGLKKKVFSTWSCKSCKINQLIHLKYPLSRNYYRACLYSSNMMLWLISYKLYFMYIEMDMWS